MAGGAVGNVGKRADQYTGRVTAYIIFTIIIAASGGFLFGYDIGVVGGVVSTHAFQIKFFPDVASEKNKNTSPWCKLNKPTVTVFVSSMYLAGSIASLAANYPQKKYGRRVTMIMAGGLFVAGATLMGAAQEIGMLIVGRVLVGFGIGLANQAVPVYLIDIAPFKWRGASNLMFFVCVTAGSLAAQAINLKTALYSTTAGGQGWRYSLGFAGIPALFLVIGSIFLTDSPGSLAERGKVHEARDALQKIRGVKEVDAEFEDIMDAANAAAAVVNPWKTILERRHRPQLIIPIILPLVNQMYGQLNIMSYGPQIFAAMGNAGDAALLSTVITGGVHVGCTFLLAVFVDWLGRRKAFIFSAAQMIVGLVSTAAILSVGINNYATIPAAYADAALATICIFIAAFSWGWGSLAWLYPQEIQTLETRSAGASIAVFFNMFIAFIMQEAFLPMLCSMQYGVWLYNAGFAVIGLAMSIWLLPETSLVPNEHMMGIFQAHWFWGPIMGTIPDDNEPAQPGDVPSLTNVKIQIQ